jgi:cytochrome c-type biogenesis protein CcmH
VKLALAALLGFLAIAPALAAEGARVDPLTDPALETRAHNLEKELRCLVCQGQSLAESNAGLASDLRKLIRDRIAAGQSDTQIKDFLVGRYGAFILMKPPLREDTFLLWFGPVLLILVGAGAVAIIVARARRRPLPAEDALTPDED